jgi:ribosomal protein S18 acetylase RimI-like enzyme
MHPPPLIRSMQTDDRDRVIDLKWSMNLFHAAIDAERHISDNDIGREAAEAAIDRDIERVRVKGGAILIAEIAHRLVGYVSWYHDQGSVSLQVHARKIAQIGGLCVDEQCRNQGIGSALLATVEAAARTQGLTRLSIGVHSANPGALRLYQRMGFHVTHLDMLKPIDDA